MPNMTPQAYAIYEAKHAKIPRLFPTATKSEGREKDLHNQILAECKRRGWIALHGSMAHSTFRTEGEWDFEIKADSGRSYMIEAKTSTGKLSPAQQALHAWARKLGHTVHVVRSFQEFLEVVK